MREAERDYWKARQACWPSWNFHEFILTLSLMHVTHRSLRVTGCTYERARELGPFECSWHSYNHLSLLTVMCKKVQPDSESPTFLPGSLTHSVSGLMFFLDVFSPFYSLIFDYIPPLSGMCKETRDMGQGKGVNSHLLVLRTRLCVAGGQGCNCPPLALRQQQERSF